MKMLHTYIKDNKSSLISLTEKFRVSDSNMKNTKYYPESWKELREIIKQRYKEQGPGTEQNPIDLNDIDVSNIDSFYDFPSNKGIFEGTKFEYINISDWDISGVKDMSVMFYNCQQLKSVGDLSNWDVSSVENMARMFNGCNNLKSVGDLSNWNVSKVEYMTNMFYGCSNLKSVGDLSDWDVSKVEYMASMFYGCSNLKSVGDLSDWDVSSVKNMNGMFYVSEITNTPDWYKE